MSEQPKSAWNGYRRWLGLSRLLVPITIYLIFNRINLPLTIPLATISVTALIAIEFFNCPRCHHPFFHISGFHAKYRYPFYRSFHPFIRKCVHCGFPKWEEPPDAPFQVTSALSALAKAEQTRLTVFLTLVLRDDPGAIDLKLDPEGWADTERLVERANRYGINLTRKSLGEIAGQSFEREPAGNHIRWAKG